MNAERTGSAWPDERLDDLAARVDAGFARVDEELRLLRTDLGGRIDAQGNSLGGRIDALQRTMLASVVTFVIGFAGLILTQL